MHAFLQKNLKMLLDFVVIFYKQILRIQGPSKGSNYPMRTRKNKIIFGSAGLILFGLMTLYKGLFGGN
jgi:hypothetical protein